MPSKPPILPPGSRHRQCKRRLALAFAVALVIAAAQFGCRRLLHVAPARGTGVDWAGLAAQLASVVAPPTKIDDDVLIPEPQALREQREVLFNRMKRRLELSDEALAQLQKIFEASPVLGQGNPKISTHPMTRAECRERRALAGLAEDRGNPMCGPPYMVPVYDPTAGEKEADAKVCIDQYEFPNIPCEYPVVLARANEVVQLCKAVGKRICDAHEWEGACAGALKPVETEYVWHQLDRIEASYAHNKKREIVWAYGPVKDHSKCATGSHKNDHCFGGGWSTCGSNTYPAGAFPECVSRFGVYDQHGNAAEHMNLPLKSEELASRGGAGSTEMKGSWFIFQSYEAHEDDCRWRAFDWHGSRLLDLNSHRNYHLGFRCCRNIESSEPKSP